MRLLTALGRRARVVHVRVALSALMTEPVIPQNQIPADILGSGADAGNLIAMLQILKRTAPKRVRLKKLDRFVLTWLCRAWPSAMASRGTESRRKLQ